MRAAAVLLVLTLTACRPIPAAEYLVSPQGSDQDAGTAAQPWRTMAKAVATLQPGDVCLVAPGTYDERVTIRRSGAAGRPITLAATGEVTMRGFELQGAQHWRLCGFRIAGVPAGQYGVLAFGAHHLEFWHNTIEHLPGGGMRFHPSQPTNFATLKGNTIAWCGEGAGGNLGITMNGEQNLIEDNDISRVADFVVMFGRRNRMRHNYLHDSYWADWPGTAHHIDGLQTYVGANYFPTKTDQLLLEANFMANVPDQHTHYLMLSDEANLGSREVLFRRNVGWRLGGYAVLAQQVDRVRLYHNTFVDLFLSSPNKTWYVLGYTGGATGGRVLNNLFSRCARDGGALYMLDQTATDFVADHNLAWQSGRPQDAHGIVGCEPQLRHDGEGDLRLSPGSPAIDAGRPLTTATSAGQGTTLTVADAGYFVDGWGRLPGDLIRIGDAIARAVAIDYERQTLTLDRPLTWRAGDGVSLAWAGAAPDIGAYEAGAATLPGTLALRLPDGPLSGTVDIDVSNAGADSIRQVVLFVDGVPTVDSREAPYRLAWDTTACPVGDHRLTVRGYAAHAGMTLWATGVADVVTTGR